MAGGLKVFQAAKGRYAMQIHAFSGQSAQNTSTVAVM